MVMSDPIADLFSRIRNGQMRGKDSVCAPDSKMKRRILVVLQSEGYIGSFTPEDAGVGVNLRIALKYHRGEPVIRSLKRVSRPGRRVYQAVGKLPRVADGLGVSVVSTPKGVLSDADARKNWVGGEVICHVF